MKSTREPKAGEYGWEGIYAPKVKQVDSCRDKFSVRIFVWIPKDRGKGLKKNHAIYHIRGYCNDPKAVYDRADEICDEINLNGLEYFRIWNKRKSETVKEKP